MYSLGTYGNTSFVVFPYFSCVEMTTDHPSTQSPSSLGQYDGLCCMLPGAATAAPDIAEFWKMESYVTKKAAAFH
jgi:hypothetical protein